MTNFIVTVSTNVAVYYRLLHRKRLAMTFTLYERSEAIKQQPYSSSMHNAGTIPRFLLEKTEFSSALAS